MSNNMGQVQFQIVKISPMVKKLIIVNLAVWLGFQTILEGFILSKDYFSEFFSMTPQYTIEYFFIWQPFTYMFLHSNSVMHVFFNMISLWFFGSELEYRWGSRSFLTYYLVCGLGAGLIYLFGVIAVGLIQGVEPTVYSIPVLGASGAVFGVFLAYGILFGDRVIYFFGIFPMKARIFIMIMGGIELVTLLNTGIGGGKVANLAHLGGIITGYLYLLWWTKRQQNRWNKGKKRKGRRNLRLVVNNSDADKDGPKYWN